MKYNYKCVLSNGNKRYYKNVNGKWKRITNKVGAKAQRGKRTYRMFKLPTIPKSNPVVEKFKPNPDYFSFWDREHEKVRAARGQKTRNFDDEYPEDEELDITEIGTVGTDKGKRDVILIKIKPYKSQSGYDVNYTAFYKSTGHNSDKKGTWLPFDGFANFKLSPSDDDYENIGWMNKNRYSSGRPPLKDSDLEPEDKKSREKLIAEEVRRENLERFGNNYFKSISRKLGGGEWGIVSIVENLETDISKKNANDLIGSNNSFGVNLKELQETTTDLPEGLPIFAWGRFR